MGKLLYSALLILAGVFSGCASIDDPGAGILNRRANLNGTITTAPMLRMPPLEKRGVKKLALVVDIKPIISFGSVGLTMFQNKYYISETPSLINEADVRAMLVKFFVNQSNITLVDYSDDRQSVVPYIKVSKWDGKATFMDDATLSSKLTEMKSAGVDAVLVITETDLPDYMGFTNQRLGPKGVYQRFANAFVYGGFEVRLMDIATKAEMSHAAYTQGSARPQASLTWKKSVSDYTDDETRMIGDELKALYLTNVDEAMHMLKAAKESR